LSCGQREGERQLAAQVADLLKREFHLRCYNASVQQGFDDVMAITEHLSRADYYLLIDFRRDGDLPVSMFTHQEFALARAWGFTEMIALIERGLKRYGMLEYVLAHPLEFERHNLLDIVRQEVRHRAWHGDFCRNLLPARLVWDSRPVKYTDHQSTADEWVYRIAIENRRSDRAAMNAVAALGNVVNANSGSPCMPDSSLLKWSGQGAYHRVIFPGKAADLDAFAVRVSEPGVFLHSASDVVPRKPILPYGRYGLEYLLYADGFPPVNFRIDLDYTPAPTASEGIKAVLRWPYDETEHGSARDG